jgi:WD40 repeat protein
MKSLVALFLPSVLLSAWLLGSPAAPPAATGKEPEQRGLLRLKGHDKHVAALAFSPDDKLLASGSLDGTICLWEVATGKQLRKWTAHKGREWEPHIIGVYSLVFSRDGKTVYSSGVEKLIRCWDPATGKEIGKLEGHQDRIATLALSPDGKLLASGSYDKTIRLWDVATGKEVRQLLGHGNRVSSIAFSPDGKQLVSGGATNEAINLPGGNVLKSGWADHVRLWDVDKGQELRKFATKGCTVAFSADGVTIAAGGSVPFIRPSPDDPTRTAIDGETSFSLLDAITGEVIRKIKYLGGAGAFSPDGKIMASYYSGAQMHASSFGSIGDYVEEVRRSDYRLRLCEMMTGKDILVLPEKWPMLMAFSFRGDRLAASNSDGQLLIWNLWSGAFNGLADQAQFEAKQLSQFWNDLTTEDAGRAYRAAWAMTTAPDQTLSLFKDMLKPSAEPEEKRVKQVLEQLGDGRFANREAAAQELKKFGRGIEPALRESLRSELPLDVRTLIEGVLADAKTAIPSAEDLRSLRGVQVLEAVGSSEARQLLETLAGGSPYALTTQHARAALARKEVRP